MNWNILKRTKQNSGIKLIISALQKHNAITILYVVFSMLNFRYSLFQSTSLLQVVSSILSLMWPIGIASTLLLKQEKHIKIMKTLLIAGITGSFIILVRLGLMQIRIMEFSLPDLEFQDRLMITINLVNILIQLGVVILLLMVIIFNTNSRSVGILLISLMISSIGLTIISIIFLFSMVNVKTDFMSFPMPAEIHFQILDSYIKHGFIFLSAIFGIFIQFIIARQLLKASRSTEDPTENII